MGVAYFMDVSFAQESCGQQQQTAEFVGKGLKRKR